MYEPGAAHLLLARPAGEGGWCVSLCVSSGSGETYLRADSTDKTGSDCTGGAAEHSDGCTSNSYSPTCLMGLLSDRLIKSLGQVTE